MIRKYAALAIISFSLLISHAQTIAPSDPRMTTHTLSSGNFTIGISSAGGGYINKVELPGKGDIMDLATDRYGRGGQSAMRDQLRSGRYNPTQAGFNEPLGTPSEIITYPDSLIIKARPCALWHGDGLYDFTRWENIGADPYQNDGGNSDVDGIEEESLEGKQLTEVTSEFDFYGIYENYLGRNGISIPCIRHYYEYRFVRPPGHCLSQFGPGTPAYKPGFLVNDISTSEPAGDQKAGEGDISNLIKVWSLRNDIAKWDPPYRHLINSEGEWILQDRTGDLPSGIIAGPGAAYQPLIIIGESADRDNGLAFGLYRPESPVNTYIVAGVDETSGTVSYQDDRRITVQILEQPRRTPTMAKYGFHLKAKGLLNRNRTEPSIYEMVRSEFYMLVGTPNEIFQAAQNIYPFRYWTHEVVSCWDFENDLEGWELTKSLSGGAENSILKLDIIGADPYMTSSNNLEIEADKMVFVSIRMKNGTSTTSGRFYWTSDSQPAFNIDYSKEITIKPQDTEFTTYLMDMTGEPNWNGVIKRIRLDPSNSATSGTVEIDYIKLREDFPNALTDVGSPFHPRTYPNPAGDFVHIETAVGSDITIFDISGKIMQKIVQAGATSSIPVLGWPPGIYFARISQSGEIRTLSFIVL